MLTVKGPCRTHKNAVISPKKPRRELAQHCLAQPYSTRHAAGATLSSFAQPLPEAVSADGPHSCYVFGCWQGAGLGGGAARKTPSRHGLRRRLSLMLHRAPRGLLSGSRARASRFRFALGPAGLATDSYQFWCSSSNCQSPFPWLLRVVLSST